MPNSSPESRIRHLEDKLELAILYLKGLDSPGAAEGYDSRISGWGITLAELIRYLESDVALPKTSRLLKKS